MESSDDRKQCPICLDTIARESEAFLDHCFHKFCYHCILQWSEMVVAHLAGPVQSLECPLCKNQYASIIHNLHGKKFQRHYIISSQGRSTGFFLSEAHLRRQAVYSAQSGHERQSTTPSLDAGLVQNRVGRFQLSTDAILRAGRNRWLRCWVQRELEALMEEEDVQIVMHHVMGVIDFYGSRSKGTTELKNKEPVQKNWRTALSTAVQPFLFENAPTFVEELEKFLKSGLDIAAYDDLGKSEHVIKEDQSDLKDLSTEKVEKMQVEDGEWVENHQGFLTAETTDHKRDRSGGHLMHTSGGPSTSGNDWDSLRDDDYCSDDVCGQRTETRKRSRRFIESESQGHEHGDKVKEKRRHRHKSVEKGRGRSPHNRRKRKKRSLSPLRQAGTIKEEIILKETKHTRDFQNKCKEQADRKRLTDNPPKIRSRSKSMLARLYASYSKTSRRKAGKGALRRKGPEESCCCSSEEEDKVLESSVDLSNPDLALRRMKGKAANVHNGQISSFVSFDAEKLDDATLEAEIHEMKLRQQALSNLMKHLEDSRRLRVETAAFHSEALDNARDLEPVQSYSPGLDRYSPRQAEGADLPSFLEDSISRSKERHDSKTGCRDTLGTHRSIEDAPSCCTLASNEQNLLPKQGRPTSSDALLPLLHRHVPKRQSSKDAGAGHGSCETNVPQLVGGGDLSKDLKSECQVVNRREANTVGIITGGSSFMPSNSAWLDPHSSHPNPAPGNVEKPSDDNICDPGRTVEKVEADALPAGRHNQALDSLSAKDPSNRKRRKIRREFDSDALSYPKEAGGSVSQMHAASENLSVEATADIQAICDHKATKKPLRLASKRLRDEEKDAVPTASPHRADAKASVETLNSGGLALQKENGGDGSRTLCAVNEVGYAAAVEGVEHRVVRRACGEACRAGLPTGGAANTSTTGVMLGKGEDASIASNIIDVCDDRGHPNNSPIIGASSALQCVGNDGSGHVGSAVAIDAVGSINGDRPTSRLSPDSLMKRSEHIRSAVTAICQQETADSAKQHLALDVESERFKQKTMSVMRGGELVEVSYKVYIPPQAAARAARRKLQR